jgi:methylmalonyl-CoA/ethylmalonyl-CoA epimerase
MENASKKQSAFTHLIHIGVVVRNMDKAIERLTALGVGPFKPRILPPENREMFRGEPFIPSERVTIQIAYIGNVELELIQPIDGASPHQEFLDKKGEGIQHLGFSVENLEDEVSRLVGEGSEIVLTSDFKGGGGVAYLDLNVADLIVELVQPGNKR